MNDRTIRYYDDHAEAFVRDTANADMSECRERFLHCLKPGQKILDAGCGSGRDAAAFLKAGYDVDAFDASAAICKIASKKTGINVRQQHFEDLEGDSQYDGIWACASLIHVRPENLPDVLNRLRKLLKPNGFLYVSFKYGTGEREKDGRYFLDLTEEACRNFLAEAGFSIRELFVTQDVRSLRSHEKWVNAIASPAAAHEKEITMNRETLVLEPLAVRLSVCKVADYAGVDLTQPFCFIGKTDEENSLVCPVSLVPDNTTERDDGWRAFRIIGQLEFSLIGILARISEILASNGIGIFAISTYNTDYVLTKEETFDKALEVLKNAGYEIKD